LTTSPTRSPVSQKVIPEKYKYGLDVEIRLPSRFPRVVEDFLGLYVPLTKESPQKSVSMVAASS
jgi:hypothetical protein